MTKVSLHFWQGGAKSFFLSGGTAKPKNNYFVWKITLYYVVCFLDFNLSEESVVIN